MASTIVLFLLFFFMLLVTMKATNTVTEKHDSSIIGLGSLLYPKGKNTSWSSSSGHFAFGFYPQGNGIAIGIWLVSPSENTTTIVWTANRDASTVSSKSMLNLTEQGLLLHNGTGDLLLNIDSRDSDSKSVSMASMHDSGNFVLYDNHSNVIWQSFGHPTDTILGGQNLTDFDSLVSSVSRLDHSSGRFYIRVQSNGNIAAYPFYSFKRDEVAYLDQQGFLCPNGGETGTAYYRLCFNNSNMPQKKSHNSTTSIYRATLDIDGNLRLYEHQFHFEQGNNSSRVVMLWQALNDICQVKGFCGLNSYCSSNMSGDAVCECYPGFILTKTKSRPNMPMDCVQMLSQDDCERNKDRTLLYNFTHFKNMSWGDIPYSVYPC